LTHDILEDEDHSEYKIAMDKLLDMMEQEMEDFHWYDAKMMRIHMQGTSMNKIHRESDIGLTSIKNTIKNGKARIYEKIKEDYQDFQNGDFDKI
jgi:predicted transcriptional regulator